MRKGIRLQRPIPDVSLCTRTGLLALAVAALAGATASLAATRLARMSPGATGAGSAPSTTASAEASFLAENRAAMTAMMAGMGIRPTGDVDRDFVDMMVPHHQGAIDMAMAVLRHGRNQKIRRLAQEIIVTQHEEIAAMRLAVGEPLPAAPADGRSTAN